jgi:hypothetical protein
MSNDIAPAFPAFVFVFLLSSVTVEAVAVLAVRELKEAVLLQEQLSLPPLE